MLCITADDDKLPSYIDLNRKTLPKKKVFPHVVIVRTQNKKQDDVRTHDGLVKCGLELAAGIPSFTKKRTFVGCVQRPHYGLSETKIHRLEYNVSYFSGWNDVTNPTIGYLGE